MLLEYSYIMVCIYMINIFLSISLELEQLKAMDRFISRCQARQCSQMQSEVRVREKYRSRCYPISSFHILFFPPNFCAFLHRSSLLVCRLHHHFQDQGCNKHVYDNANKYHHNSSYSSPFHMLVCYRDTDCKNCSCKHTALLSTILLPKFVYDMRAKLC